MRPRIWLEANLTSESAARLDSIAGVIRSSELADVPGSDLVIISSLVDARAAFMELAGPQLQLIARPGIGVDNVDIPAATSRGILVINTPDAPSESTAEHAIALLLALAKRVVLGDRDLHGRDVPREHLLGTEVRGRSVGVIGMGRIGRRVAHVCGKGLGMHVIAYDPYIPSAVLDEIGIEVVDRLDDLLARADFVTLHASLTPATRGLIGARELERMKPGAYLINVSRGPMVDEAALARALSEGRLAGAALDVFDPEPPHPDNPLLKLPNVITTPHIGSFTDLGTAGMSRGTVDQIFQFLRGERPSFLLNPDALPGRAGIL